VLLIAVLVFHHLPAPVFAQSPVVRADGAAAWGTGVRLVPVGSLGTIDGPPEYALGSVARLVGTSKGDFYTYDAQAVQIRHYTADGKFIGNVGRRGSGPGEYQQILGFVLLGDSVLVTWDPGNLRISYFGRNDKFLRSISAAVSSAVFGPDVFAVDLAGRVIVQCRTTNDSSIYVRLRPDGTVIDSLRGSKAGEMGFVLGLPEGSRYNFIRTALVKPSPLGGLLKAMTAVLGFTAETGGTEVTVVRKSTPIQLGKEERVEWEQAATMFNRRPNLPPNARMSIPPTKPAIRDLFADRDGRVWLDAYAPAEHRPTPVTGKARPKITWFERATFEVFSVAGRYLGRVVLPPKHELIAVSGDRIWTYTSGPDDEIRIGIFKMVRASGAPL
jgi:hypothetical protein